MTRNEAQIANIPEPTITNFLDAPRNVEPLVAPNVACGQNRQDEVLQVSPTCRYTCAGHKGGYQDFEGYSPIESRSLSYWLGELSLPAWSAKAKTKLINRALTIHKAQ